MSAMGAHKANIIELPASFRLLVVDADSVLSTELGQILSPKDFGSKLDSIETALFTNDDGPRRRTPFRIDRCDSLVEAMERCQRTQHEGERYALAFLDSPPIDGGSATAIEGLMALDPQLQLVVCAQPTKIDGARLGRGLHQSHRLAILRRPLMALEVTQLVRLLCAKHEGERALLQRQRGPDRQTSTQRTARSATNAQVHNETTERQRMELELRVAHKLEAVGQLAAGVAHEINTPLQYISDSVTFVREAMDSLFARLVLPKSPTSHRFPLDPEVQELIPEVNDAFDTIFEGLGRVTAIVAAMRKVAHPGDAQRTLADINDILKDALLIARGEYRHVAKVDTTFTALPLIHCNAPELHQVFLNLIINAAHAIADDPRRDTTGLGTIAVETTLSEDSILVAISDTGAGIASEHRDRVFDLFFTTKEVGRGSGQGLSISRAIVEKHGGELEFESTPGAGSRFTVRVPLKPSEHQDAHPRC